MNTLPFALSPSEISNLKRFAQIELPAQLQDYLLWSKKEKNFKVYLALSLVTFRDLLELIHFDFAFENADHLGV